MAKKRRKLTTPEYDAEVDARIARTRALLIEMEARAVAQHKARTEELERRRHGWRRFIPFRRAA